jgi:uncharacterized protein GlcG (DUF336 family)
MLELRHLATAAAAAVAAALALAVSFTVMDYDGRVSMQINKTGAHICHVLNKNTVVWKECYRLSDLMKDR